VNDPFSGRDLSVPTECVQPVALTVPSPVPGMPGTPEVDVVVLMCCHNRRQRTTTAIRGLLNQELRQSIRLGIVVVDDGSTDGTSEAVVFECPTAHIVPANGDLFWSRAMALAQEEALSRVTPAFLLWLNDDVEIMPNALQRLLDTATKAGSEHVIVGALQDPKTGATTYSAFRRTGSSPQRIEAILPSGNPSSGDTFNGNVVLVPRAVYSHVGAVDKRFQHAWGDVDYGYRVKNSGFQITLSPGHIGYCARNSTNATWRDAGMRRSIRLKQFLGPKGLPIRSSLLFLRRHVGFKWPIFAISSYSRPLLAIILGRAVADGGAPRNDDSLDTSESSDE
jgi:GT2 family glycosyltransferase